VLDIDVNKFDRLRIGLASSEQIRQWSRGEVKKPETINYRTLKPEKDGLFCEKIFGPTKDWECYCGKYKRVRFKGIICERCGVEVTRSKVRRDRMGHIELAAPVSHIWYFKGVPSRMGYLLDITPKDLEKVLYFASYIITSVNEEDREEALPEEKAKVEEDIAALEAEKVEEIAALEAERDREIAVARGEIEPETPEPPLAEGETPVDPETRVKKINDRTKREIADTEEEYEERAHLLKAAFDEFQKLSVKHLINSETLYRELKVRYGNYFRGGMGAEAVKALLADIDLGDLADELRDIIRDGKGQKRQKAIKRLKVVASFKGSQNAPEWMILDAIPVIPPDLRPMVQLDGGRFATSDLNDLYRRVINRNNRLKRLLDLGAPEIIVNNEKRMLQEAVDALFDNGRRGRPVTGPGNRPLKSLSDMLKGKQGRFRQNLLGKRVDYSGRSVIVVGPELKLHQCGLPKAMALELFKPFVMKRLVDLEYAQNIKSAKRMVERGKKEVWDVLEEVISEHPVMLNRAPTLHRLGIQAFEPVLVEGKAIRIPPLVTTAFNADFDGDQMAVHLPLSAEAQAEARILMLSANNIKSPAHGRPLATPTQDMVMGIFSLTAVRPGSHGAMPLGKDGEPDKSNPAAGRFASFDDAILAYDNRGIDLQAEVEVRLPADTVVELAPNEFEDRKAGERIRSTVGRVIFNRALPEDYPFINHEVDKKGVARIVEDCSRKYSTTEMGVILDEIKRLGFHYATRAGITVSVYDAAIPPQKEEIIGRAETHVAGIEEQYDMGLITHDERHRKIVDTWTAATEEVGQAMADNFVENHAFNSIYMMANSGARGNIKQVRQLAGMRGLMANPKGDILDRPIKANFREGLTVLEYFISTHGARKGLADTALRTADSGYLTRRLVDVAQDVIIREIDCGTDDGFTYPLSDENGRLVQGALEKLTGRALVRDIMDPAKARTALMKAGTYLEGETMLNDLAAKGVREVTVRTVMTCHSTYGLCQTCYGWDLASSRPVDLGTAVGIIAAQSIGEPGTQLTMRTFHTGGVAGEDITHGLPRVTELFEARKPKGQAAIAEISGTLSILEEDKTRTLTIVESKIGARPKPVRLLPATVSRFLEMSEEELAGVFPKTLVAALTKGIDRWKRETEAASAAASEDVGLADLPGLTEANKKRIGDDPMRVSEYLALSDEDRAGMYPKTLVAGLGKAIDRWNREASAAVAASDEDPSLEDLPGVSAAQLKVLAAKTAAADAAQASVEKAYTVSRRARLKPGVVDGTEVVAGTQLTEGSVNPHELLAIKGPNDTLAYIVEQVQEVYRSQGVDINDKHIEVISRQMLRKVSVTDAGDTDFLPGALVDRFVFDQANELMLAEGVDPATAEPALLGITKASLATDSYLSAASFQETTRVLTDAAIAGKSDELVGLKENVIIGKLIPAGTGMREYRNVRLTYKGKSAEYDLMEGRTGPLPEFAPEELKELEALLPEAPPPFDESMLGEDSSLSFFDFGEAASFGGQEGDEDFDATAYTGTVFDPNEELKAAAEAVESADESVAETADDAVSPAVRDVAGEPDACAATTASGAPCKNKALPGARYCRTHEGQAATDGLCKALMKNGKPCPKKAKDDGDFCGQHAKLA
jgi:DNA-directed RNA polymerase subunit beta'